MYKQQEDLRNYYQLLTQNYPRDPNYISPAYPIEFDVAYIFLKTAVYLILFLLISCDSVVYGGKPKAEMFKNSFSHPWAHRGSIFWPSLATQPNIDSRSINRVVGLSISSKVD